jgi:hypothetical protein
VNVIFPITSLCSILHPGNKAKRALLPVTSENTDEEVPVANEDELSVSSEQGIYFPFNKLQPFLDHI